MEKVRERRGDLGFIFHKADAIRSLAGNVWELDVHDVHDEDDVHDDTYDK